MHVRLALQSLEQPRLGEALGLKWGDIDWNGGFLTVQRDRWRDHTASPKTAGSIRRVNLSSETIELLREHRRVEAAVALKAGRPMPEQVFVQEAGSPADESIVRKAHDLALKAAGLRRIRVHDMQTEASHKEASVRLDSAIA